MKRRSVFAAVGVGLMLSAAASFAGPLRVAAVNPIASLVFTPNATTIAPTGTLASAAMVTVTVTARDGSNTTIGGATVYLSFVAALAGPSGSTVTADQSFLGSPPGCGAACPVTSSPTAFTTNSTSGHVGEIPITFHRGTKPSVGGSDVITAQDAASSPTVSSTNKYGYIKNFLLSPAGPKIAADGTIAANTTTNVTVTAVDDLGTAAPNAKIAMSFTPTAGGGSATAAGKFPAAPLNATLTIFDADNSGNVTVAYTTPSTLPSSGTDTVVAADQSNTATPPLSVPDSYTFTPAPPPPPPPSTPSGYYTVASDGGIFSFGSQPGFPGFFGSTGAIKLNQPVVGMAVMPDKQGYFMVAKDGGIFTFGSAVPHFHGSTGAMKLNAPIVGMALMPDGDGYFLVASDGGIFTFGSAVPHFHGSTGAMKLNQPIVGMALMPDGDGYFLVASDGGIFTFGSAVPHFHGSMGAVKLNQPVVGMAMTPDGDGYYMVASDGGIFSFGTAAPKFYGSMGAVKLNQPVVGMAEATDGLGYYMVASDGGIFSFGSVASKFYGSMGAVKLNQPMVGMAVVG
jgi:ribosomal protein L24E